MNYKNILKKETKVIAYVVICLTLVVVGVSYAMFLQVNKNSDNQTVETGTLVITYKNGNKEAITDANIVSSGLCLEPVSDSEATTMSKDCSYMLNILNTGSLPASYKIVMYNNKAKLQSAHAGGVSVLHDHLRIGLKKGNDTLSPVGEAKALSAFTKTGENAEDGTPKYVIAEGTLEAGKDITYSVQAWIAENADISAISNRYVYLKVDVNSVVQDDAPITSDNTSGGVVE